MEKVDGKIKHLIWQSRDILHLIIRLDKEMNFKPGEFVKMTYKGTVRPYSVCNFRPGDVLELFIKLKDGGEMSGKLENARFDDPVTIEGAFTEADFSADKILCLAGGSGQAAFMSLLRGVENEDMDKDVVLFQCSRNITQVGFLGELERLKRCRAYVTLSREKREGYRNGHISRKMVEEILNPCEYEIFICGPKSFTQALGKEFEDCDPHLMSW